MTTAYSTQGKRLAFGQQSAFNTPQTTLKDIRPEEEFTIADPVDVGNTPATIHANVNDTEKPVTLERPRNDCATAKVLLRQAASAGGTSFIQQAFESGGLTASSGNDTTISAYSSTTDFTATDDNFQTGQGVVVELDDGTWFPTLIAAYTAGAITPGMALPSASSATNALNKCVTITPGDVGSITASKLLTIKGFTRAGGAKDIRWQDCAATSYGEISLEPGSFISFSFTFGGSGYTESTDGLGINDFNDATATKLFENPIYGFANANSAGGIASTLGQIRSAKINIRNTAVMIESTGDTTSKNDMCGWMKKQDVTQPVLTIEQLFSQDELDRWNGTNASKYISITQPSNSETEPSFAFILPNAHLASEPAIDMAGDFYIVTSSWIGKPAGYDSSTSTADPANQPWYLLLGERSA